MHTHYDAEVLPLGQAIRKLTGEQADWYGIDAVYLRVGDRADVAVIGPAGLDERLDGYHEAPMTIFGGLRRMVRRNDAAVRATLIAGEPVFERGAFADGFGQERRTGSFLRVGERVGPPAASSAAHVSAAARPAGSSAAAQTQAA